MDHGERKNGGVPNVHERRIRLIKSVFKKPGERAREVGFKYSLGSGGRTL